MDKITTTPNSSDIDFLTQQINKETPEFGMAIHLESSLRTIQVKLLRERMALSFMEQFIRISSGLPPSIVVMD
jgi:hypothetical protein